MEIKARQLIVYLGEVALVSFGVFVIAELLKPGLVTRSVDLLLYGALVCVLMMFQRKEPFFPLGVRPPEVMIAPTLILLSMLIIGVLVYPISLVFSVALSFFIGIVIYQVKHILDN